MTIVKKIFGIIGIAIAIQYGIFGLLYFQLVSSIFDYNLDAHFGGRLINYSIFEQVKDIFPSVFLAATTGMIVYGVDSYFNNVYPVSDLIRIALAGMCYFTIYLGIGYFLKLKAFKDFRLLVFKK